MRRGNTVVSSMLIMTGIILMIFLVMQPFTIYQFKEKLAVLFPKGIIALEERNLLFILQGIMLIIVIPVYILTFIFSWKYSVQNPKEKYEPDLIDNKFAEILWWGIPLVLTAIVGALTWIKTEELDPYKPIVSDKKPLHIQVVALQWQWLFLYPEEKIASLNFLQFPKDRPLFFEITADAPMNSFWIPHLGGQIYAMPNMRTKLHLIANETGDFRGSSANISGEGFAGMNFIARSSTDEQFEEWVKGIKNGAQQLTREGYNILALPTENRGVETFLLQSENLFDQIIDKYMKPQEK